MTTQPRDPNPQPQPHEPARPLTTSPPSPPLSPSDRTLLFAYFDHHENLAALATHLTSQAAASPLMPDAQCLMPSSDYFSLLSWLNQPHIQQALEAHDHAIARADRRAALQALRQSLETADNPTNLRRAATILLRSTIVRTTPEKGPDRHEGRAPRPSTSIPSTPSPPSPPHLHHPLSPLPPLPPPTSRPTPTADPAAVFAHIKAALTAPQLPLTLATIHAHAAHITSPPLPGSAESGQGEGSDSATALPPSTASPSVPSPPTFAGYPIPQDPAAWPDSFAKTLPKDFFLPLRIENPQEVERTEAISRWNFWAATPNRILFECAATLARDGPDHPAPAWRLASLDILRRSG